MYAGLPDNSIARNVAQIYKLLAGDIKTTHVRRRLSSVQLYWPNFMMPLKNRQKAELLSIIP